MIKIDECLQLSENVVQSAMDAIHDHCGVELTLAQCVEVIRTSKTLAADLYASNGAGDTCTREYLIDTLVRKLMGRGRRWPINGDPVEVRTKFYQDFEVSAKQAGYKLLGQ